MKSLVVWSEKATRCVRFTSMARSLLGANLRHLQYVLLLPTFKGAIVHEIVGRSYASTLSNHAARPRRPWPSKASPLEKRLEKTE